MLSRFRAYPQKPQSIGLYGLSSFWGRHSATWEFFRCPEQRSFKESSRLPFMLDNRPQSKWCAMYSWSIPKFPPYWSAPAQVVTPYSQWTRQIGSHRTKIWSPAANPVRTFHTTSSMKMVHYLGWPGSLLEWRILRPRFWQSFFLNFAALFLFRQLKLNSSQLSTQINGPNIMKTEFNADDRRQQCEKTQYRGS